MVTAICPLRAAEPEKRSTAGPPSLTFEEHIHPILKTHCFYCHGEADEREGSLDLRLRRWLVRGGDSGPAIEPGNADQSLLLERVANGDMPPGDDQRLSDSEVDRIRRWIAAGAATLEDEPLTLDAPRFTQAERNWWAFRPVRPPATPNVQQPANNVIDALLLQRMKTQSNAIASFAPLAGRRRLIRRLYLDVLGTPPSPAEVAAFVADERPHAWGRLVDEVLASPRYGERWGRHWLDAAGYADSDGYTEADPERPHAYRYRDYVIRSWNRGLRYDQFLREQLAGDELADWNSSGGGALTPETQRLLTATGFLRMAPDGAAAAGVDKIVARNQAIADTLQIVGSTLTGVTMHCAQCHDHRYDPIPQADYFRLRAVFAPALNWQRWPSPQDRQVSLYTAKDREQRAAIEAEAGAVDAQRKQRVKFFIQRVLEQELLLEPPRERDAIRQAFQTAAKERTPEQQSLLKSRPNIERITEGSLYLYDRRKQTRTRNLKARQGELDPEADQAEIKRIDEAIAEIEKQNIRKELQQFADQAAKIRSTIPPEHFLRVLTEPDTMSQPPPATRVFHRGDHQQLREQVGPAGLSILELPYQPEEGLKTSGRRLAYANHLLDPRHPLVARTFVNRLWAHHFGRGIADALGDFGRLGERPTHPELLDYLAAELLRCDWDVKQLQRQILNTHAYRQSFNGSPEQIDADPENRWYSRWTSRRLEAEAVRDAMLAVAGKLNLEMYGPPVPVMEDGVGQIVLGKEKLDGERKPTKPEPLLGQEFRRSLYIQVRRSRPLSVLESFDLPETTPHCTKRASSNVTPQSLVLMNSNLLIELSRAFATRLQTRSDDLDEQLVDAWQLAYSQPLDDSTRQRLAAFVREQRAVVGNDLDALASLCQALLSANRFLYIE